MKKFFASWFAVTLTILTAVPLGHATPSTTYWTTACSDIQPFGVFHITADNYFDGDSSFPGDYGLTVGVLPFEKFQMELGFDFLAPADDPLYFNAKVGTPEGKLFNESPAWNIGIWNIGTEEDSTNYDIFQITIGKTIPWNLGRIHLAGYFGLTETLETTASSGDGDRAGFMIGYDKYIWKDKIMFAADYATGKNAIGGGGLGLYYFFTPNISLLSGPVWFNDPDLNGDWKWTVQLDVNFKF